VKFKVIKKFLIRRLRGGHCDLCRKFRLVGLQFDKEFVCFNCIRLGMMYLGKQFDLTAIFGVGKIKKIKFREDLEEVPFADVFEKVKRKTLRQSQPFTKAELEEMKHGSMLVKKKEKSEMPKSGFSWIDVE